MQKIEKVQQLIHIMAKEFKKNKVAVKLVPQRVVHIPELNICTNGIFCELYDKTAILQIAIKKPVEKWFPVLLHEYCHMKQWVHKKKLWNSAALSKKEIRKYAKLNHDISDISDVFDLWLSGKLELSLREIQNCIKRIITIELDCEKRVVTLIKKYKIPIDTVEYTQKANAYLYYYQFARKYRNWYMSSKEPSLLEDIWTKMPTTFTLKYFNYMPPNYNKIYERVYAIKNVKR